jgi:hypothetical protein
VLLSAQNVTSLVDQDKVARELGVNTDKDDVAAVASRKEADTMKAALIDAYSAASSAILDRVKLLSLEIEGKGGVICDTSASASAPGPTIGEVPSSTSTVSAETVTVTPPSVSSSSSVPTPSASSSSLSESSVDAKASPAAVSDLIEKRTQALTKDFDAACKQLQRWDDLNSDKHWLLCINRMKVKNLWGSALKKINDLASSSADNKFKGEAVSREVLNEVPGPTQLMYCVLYTMYY